jgi:hypothetical protein
MSDQKQLHRDTIWPVHAFACPVCNSYTPFETDECFSCQTALGLHLPSKRMLTLDDGVANVDGVDAIRLEVDVDVLQPGRHGDG